MQYVIFAIKTAITAQHQLDLIALDLYDILRINQIDDILRMSS